MGGLATLLGYLCDLGGCILKVQSQNPGTVNALGSGGLQISLNSCLPVESQVSVARPYGIFIRNFFTISCNVKKDPELNSSDGFLLISLIYVTVTG